MGWFCHLSIFGCGDYIQPFCWQDNTGGWKKKFGDDRHVVDGSFIHIVWFYFLY